MTLVNVGNNHILGRYDNPLWGHSQKLITKNYSSPNNRKNLIMNNTSSDKTFGRDAFLSLLVDEGVTHLFGNPGTTELPIMHALSDHTSLTYVLGLQESVVVAMADGKTVCHRKLHCFVSKHMMSGDQFTVFELPSGWKAAILICYDNNLIENVRACALAGAEVIFAPHQTGGCNSGSPFAMGVIDRVRGADI